MNKLIYAFSGSRNPILYPLFFSLFMPLFVCAQTVTPAGTTPSAESQAVLPLIEELSKTVKSGTSAEQRLKAAERLAPLQEQTGLYAEASATYGTAASLAGVQSERGQRLLLGSVRCALSSADVSAADFLLSTAFSSPATAEIRSSAKLYALWSWIIKAQNQKELEGPVSVLKSYAAAQDMASLKPVILLTLHHITEEKKWAEALAREFPDSPEAAVAAGNARTLPAPFWFFLKTQTEPEDSAP
ncbi:hypothetical protein V1L52_10590 [Treponema sp. HNW]|uniref:hypothetical protein n=1 Tax=Treponema sp. HNW TaxID=3116654 RepID=UPI003D0F9A00